MERIADGNYGTCLECEEEIGQKRLQAMPWAVLCITCQDKADRGAREASGPGREFLPEAA
jgi:DnaK suppressor protein